MDRQCLRFWRKNGGIENCSGEKSEFVYICEYMGRSVKFCQIRHREVKSGKVYTSYLGDVQLDVPHTTRFYSKTTNQIVEVTVDAKGNVSRKVLDSKKRVSCPDSIAIIEVAESEKTNGKLSGPGQSLKISQKSQVQPVDDGGETGKH